MLKLVKPGKRIKNGRPNKYYLIRGAVVAGGKEYEIATRTTDEVVAGRIKNDAERRLLNQIGAAPTPVNARFEDAVRLHADKTNPTGNEKRYIDRLSEYFRGRFLSSLTQADVIAAANVLYPDALPQTRNRQVIAPCSAILHVAAENNLMPYMRIDRLKSEDPERPIARLETTEKYIAECTDPHGKVALKIFAYQGWRVTETLNIRRDKIDEKEPRMLRFVSKSRKWRWAALDPEVWQDLLALPKSGDGYVFPWRTRHKFYRGVLAELREKIGEDFTPHRARRGFATELIEAGADLKSIMAAGSWEDLKSVAVYAHADLDQARKTIDKRRAVFRATAGKDKGIKVA